MRRPKAVVQWCYCFYLMSCCPDGAIGPAPPSDDVPKGTTLEIPGVDDETVSFPPLSCYYTGPSIESKPKRVVVIFSDVYGLETGNHKYVADFLASQLDDTCVCIPDLFRGDPILKAWFPNHLSEMAGSVFGAPNMLYKLRMHYTPDRVDGEIVHVLGPWLQQTFPQAVMACVGFCFGGWVVGRTLALKDCPFRAGVGMHPSFQPELVHLASQEALAARIAEHNKPLLLMPAYNDDLKPKSKVVQMLAAARNVEPEDVAVEFPSQSHGWVTRGDRNDPETSKEQERALKLTVEFIEKHCGLDSETSRAL